MKEQILTTKGLFDRETAKKLISLKLAKGVRLDDKNIFQLKKLSKRHKALRLAIYAEVEERASRVKRAEDLKTQLKAIHEGSV
jgi:hypothetical protein